MDYSCQLSLVVYIGFCPQLSFYLIFLSGVYKMDVRYGGKVVNGSPYQISTYDVNKIKVYDMKDAILNVENSFHGTLQSRYYL